MDVVPVVVYCTSTSNGRMILRNAFSSLQNYNQSIEEKKKYFYDTHTLHIGSTYITIQTVMGEEITSWRTDKKIFE